LGCSKPVAGIAERLGITVQTAYNWRKQDRVDRGIEPGTSTCGSAELTAARKRIWELTTDLAVTTQVAKLLKAQLDPFFRKTITASDALGPFAFRMSGARHGAPRTTRRQRWPPGGVKGRSDR